MSSRNLDVINPCLERNISKASDAFAFTLVFMFILFNKIHLNYWFVMIFDEYFLIFGLVEIWCKLEKERVNSELKRVILENYRE